MKKFIYLAGPIAGCTLEEATEWRDYVRSMLPHGIIGISPLRCEPVQPGMRYDDPGAVDKLWSDPRSINAKNWLDTESCDLVLAYLPKEMNDRRPSIGTIIEIGDYQCPACKLWFDNTRQDIIENYIDTGKASLTFIDLPILGPDSKLAAAATYCADDQGRYWDYHVTLYDYQGHMNSGWASSDRLKAIAFNLDMNMDEFEECLDSSKYEERIKFNAKKAKSGGANSTPTFVIVNTSGDSKRIVGAHPYSTFEEIINAML